MLFRNVATAVSLAYILVAGTVCAQTTPVAASTTQSAPPQSPAAPAASSPVAQIDTHAPDYRSGLADGCLHATNGMRRNETRFEADALYHAGWQKGFDNCYPHQTIHSNGDPNGPMGKNLY